MDGVLSGPAQYIFFVGVIVVCWEVVKAIVGALLGTGKSEEKNGDHVISADEYPDIDIPTEPHMEMSTVPTNGLKCSNPREPFSFENEYATGKLLFFHPPTDPRAQTQAGGLDYRKYFEGKKRIWELRIQFQFKTPPSSGSDLYFGIEMEQYVPLSAATKKVVVLAANAIKHAVGGLYQSPGDDPAQVSGERERPLCVLPLWAFDQFIVTREGDSPPDLRDPDFPNMGSKRYQRISEYAAEVTDLVRTIDDKRTYTFAFWGNSRFLDVLNWRLIGLPVVTPMDFDKLAGEPPVYAVLYSLKEGSGDDGEKRHLNSRKNYYFRTALWSSKRRPERQRFESLTGAAMSSVDTAGPALKRGSSGRFGRGYLAFFADRLACCVSRTPDHDQKTR
eukprot:TRINITY_DN23799_c0_g1_i2.p1 TRINITY_DN23799_c0_g1~~TRINITY_DN23799_c0_g1_i2.p1  ORF type:complete len:440 (+),score=103.34 TRINITY_DN23799_c0_g1_i2:151-1320(+)